MNMTAIKDWFATVDISHIDWRIRWPVFILPFLLIALIYTLLRANQLSGVQAELVSELQSLAQPISSVSGGTSSSSTTSAASDATSDATQLLNGMTQLEGSATTLQQWLGQGRQSKPYVEHAAFLARIAGEQNSTAGLLPDVEFWNGFSDVLAILENGVIQGRIDTPESRELIQNMRFEYAEMRATQLGPVASTAAASTAVELSPQPNTSSGSAEQLGAISGAVQNVLEQRSNITRLNNRALILTALSSVLVGLLFWGLWRRSHTNRYDDLGKQSNEQSAILRLLDEITPLANGDLRVQATVTEASTGAIADAFNFAVEELRRLVLAVTDSAELVRTSVHETRESAHHLARASSVQAREIHRSSNYLNVMSDTMAQLSAHAVESSRIAELSVQQAVSGNVAVQANVDALSRIREQAAGTTRLMQRLVETSAAINERVNDIESVAKRTDLLALNATIRASAHLSTHASTQYGANSENVSMLSDDIAYLAETLGRASRDISNLSDLIQQDATITLQSMADTVNELDDGQRTALQASDNLHEIDRVSNELNTLIDDIASKSLRQAGVVKQLSGNMGVINNITRDSAVQLQESASSLKQLESITTELRNSVSDFKLPRSESARHVQEANSHVGPQRKPSIKNKVARAKSAQDSVKHA